MAEFAFSPAFSSAFAAGDNDAVVTLPLDIAVLPSGQPALPLDVAMVPVAWLAGLETASESGDHAASWVTVVTLAGNDVSDWLVGQATVEAEEGSARIADLTLCPPAGAVVLSEWTGRPVTVGIGALVGGVVLYEQRLFAGVVDNPTVDLKARTIHLLCSDDVQGRVSALTVAQVDALVGGAYSGAVFDKAATPWRRFQDRLSTLAASVDIAPDGQLRKTAWAAKTVADLTFDADLVADGSVSVSLAERSSLVNQVDVEFVYRYPLLKAEGHPVTFSYVNATNFAAFTLADNWFLQRDAVLAAISAAGGHPVGDVTWEALPTDPIGIWYPGPNDGELCMGFTATVAFDYVQTVDETHRLRVFNPLSQAAMGPLADKLSGALDAEQASAAALEQGANLRRGGFLSTTVAEVGDVVAGFVTPTVPSLTTDTDRLAATAAIDTLVAIARTKIAAAHRLTEVGFAVPLNPAIDLDKTVALDAMGVQAKAKVKRLRHEMDADAGAAMTTVTLAVSSLAGVGITHIEDAAVAATYAPPSTPLSAPLVTYNAGPLEDHVITINFPGVEAADREKASPVLASEIRAAIPEDVFTIVL